MYLVGLLLLGGWCFFRAVADCDDHFVCGWLLAAAGCDVLVVAVSSWLLRLGLACLCFWCLAVVWVMFVVVMPLCCVASGLVGFVVLV